MNEWDEQPKPKRADSYTIELILRRLLQITAVFVIITWFRSWYAVAEIYVNIHGAEQRLSVVDSSLASFYVLVSFVQPITLTVVWFLMTWIFRLQYSPMATKAGPVQETGE